MDLVDIVRVVRIHQGAQGDDDVARARHVAIVGVVAGLVFDVADHIVVLVDHLHGPKALAGVRQGDGDRPGVQVDDGGRVEGVAVGADDALMFDRHRLAMMPELAGPAGVLQRIAEIEVALGPGEIVDSDANPLGFLGLRRPTAHREQGGDHQRSHSSTLLGRRDATSAGGEPTLCTRVCESPVMRKSWCPWPAHPI